MPGHRPLESGHGLLEIETTHEGRIGEPLEGESDAGDGQEPGRHAAAIDGTACRIERCGREALEHARHGLLDGMLRGHVAIQIGAEEPGVEQHPGVLAGAIVAEHGELLAARERTVPRAAAEGRVYAAAQVLFSESVRNQQLTDPLLMQGFAGV